FVHNRPVTKTSSAFPSTTLFRSILASEKKLMNVIKKELEEIGEKYADARRTKLVDSFDEIVIEEEAPVADEVTVVITRAGFVRRSEEHTSELQSRFDLVCRLLLE